MYITVISIVLFLQSAIVSCTRISLRKRENQRRSGLAEGEYAIGLDHAHMNYFGQIRVGTASEGEKEQVFTINFDTGSPHLWLSSVDACPQKDCTGKNFVAFDGSKSLSYKNYEQPFRIGYSDGSSVTGHLAQDTLKLGIGEKAIVIQNQVFGEATNLTNMNVNADGILGLSLHTHSRFPGNPEPPLWSMVRQVNILPEFGIYLDRHNKGQSFDAGELVFGGHDEDLVEGEFSFNQVQKVNGLYDGWRVKLDKISVDWYSKRILELPQPDDVHVLPDSGCNAMTGPSSVFNEVHKSIYNNAEFDYSKIFHFNCNADWKHLPNVTFTIGQVYYVLIPEDYIWVLGYGSNLCRSLFLGKPSATSFVLGQPFMERYYTKYDMLNQRVGFAKAKMRAPP